MPGQDFWWSYWYFHFPNYAFALLFWTLIGRFMFALFLPPDSPNYIYRWFRRLTDWLMRPVAFITPSIVPPLALAPIAAFWVAMARVAFFIALHAAGFTPLVAQQSGMVDRHTLLLLVLGLCLVNGMFSPYLNIAIPVTAALMPELFPRTIEWVLFWSSILLSSATLLFSGVPAALYERLVEREPESTVSMWIWFAGAAALSLPVAQRLL